MAFNVGLFLQSEMRQIKFSDDGNINGYQHHGWKCIVWYEFRLDNDDDDDQDANSSPFKVK